MSSKYDNIKTATEMVQEVICHGLSTNREDIIRVQDIFGQSTIGELDRLANDIGRNNEYGEPDPKGTYSSIRHPTRDVFYMILFNIWSWEEATRFWNQHSNPEREELLKLRNTCKEWSEHSDNQDKLYEELRSDYLGECNLRLDTEEKLKSAREEIEAKDLEIMKLKAKLYDLMTEDT